MSLLTVVVAFILISPFTEPFGTFTDLDGTVGMMDHMDIWSSVNIAAGSIYAFGDMFCHQMFSRSFILNGSQTAVCVRDVATMIGMIIGFACVNFIPSGTISERKFPIIAAVLLLPVLIDWPLQFFTHFDSFAMRIVSGVSMGISFAMIITILTKRMFDRVLPSEE